MWKGCGEWASTPMRALAAVFKFAKIFCVWLRLVRSAPVSLENHRDLLRLTPSVCVCLRVNVPKMCPSFVAWLESDAEGGNCGA